MLGLVALLDVAVVGTVTRAAAGPTVGVALGRCRPIESAVWVVLLSFEPVWSWETTSPAPAPSVSPPPADWDCSFDCSVSLPFSARRLGAGLVALLDVAVVRTVTARCRCPTRWCCSGSCRRSKWSPGPSSCCCRPTGSGSHRRLHPRLRCRHRRPTAPARWSAPSRCRSRLTPRSGLVALLDVAVVGTVTRAAAGPTVGVALVGGGHESAVWVVLLSFDPVWSWVTSSPEPAPSVSPLPADCSCSWPCSVSLPFSAPDAVSASFACSASPLFERSPLPEPVPVVLLWSVVAVSVALCVVLLVSVPVCVCEAVSPAPASWPYATAGLPAMASARMLTTSASLRLNVFLQSNFDRRVEAPGVAPIGAPERLAGVLDWGDVCRRPPDSRRVAKSCVQSGGIMRATVRRPSAVSMTSAAPPPPPPPNRLKKSIALPELSTRTSPAPLVLACAAWRAARSRAASDGIRAAAVAMEPKRVRLASTAVASPPLDPPDSKMKASPLSVHANSSPASAGGSAAGAAKTSLVAGVGSWPGSRPG